MTLVVGLTVALVAWSGPAFADCHGNGVDSGWETTNAGIGSSEQVIRWNLDDRKVRLKAPTGNGMDTDNCHDANYDWITSAGHYDGRYARNCDPGTALESDPTGDGWWSEPTNWGGRDVNGIQKGAGLVYEESSTDYLSDEYVPQSVCENFQSVPFSTQDPPPGLRYMWRTGSGVVWYWDGGNVSSPND